MKVAWRAAADVDRLCRVHMGTAPAIEVGSRALLLAAERVRIVPECVVRVIPGRILLLSYTVVGSSMNAVLPPRLHPSTSKGGWPR